MMEYSVVRLMLPVISSLFTVNYELLTINYCP
jgi:hypothetical protein